MLDEKMIGEIKRRVTGYISEGSIKKAGDKGFVKFFLNNAKNSLEAAKLLFDASTDENLQRATGLTGFNGFLWVVNASYYSMFYMARALLENEGIKIKTDLSIHAVTYDALVYYFYLTGKLQKRIIEEFTKAKQDAAEMGGQEKAKELMEDYFFEKRKRGVFTYEMGASAMENKAETSLNRAKRFNEEIRKIIEI